MASPEDEGGIAAELSEDEREDTSYGVLSQADEEEQSLDSRDILDEDVTPVEPQTSSQVEVMVEEDLAEAAPPDLEVKTKDVEEGVSGIEEEVVLGEDEYTPEQIPEKETKLGDVEMREGPSEEVAPEYELSDEEGILTEDQDFLPDYKYAGRIVEDEFEGEEEEELTIAPDVLRKLIRRLKHLPTCEAQIGLQNLLGPRLVKELLPGIDECLLQEESSDEIISAGTSEALITTEVFTRPHVESAPPISPPGEFDVLEADNPMLIRFQEVLKRHLISQKERLLRQISELENDLKGTKDDIKKLGESIARELKIIKQQQEHINNFKKNMATVNEEIHKIGGSIEDQRINFKQLKTELTEKKRNLNSLEQEKEMYQQLLYKMESYKEFQDGQLRINKLQTARNKVEIKQMLEEKQKQDLILWRLTQIILQLKRNYDASEKNIYTIRQTVEKVESNVSTAEVDIESLKLENILIRQTINKSFETVNIKNQAYPTEKQNLQYVKDIYIELINQIRGVSKSFEEMKKTEEQNRIRFSKAWAKTVELKNNMQTVSHSVILSENMLLQFQTIFENNEKRLELTKKETKNLENEHKKVLKKLNDEFSKHNEMKTRLLDKLNENNITEIFKNRIDKQIKKLAQDAKVQEVELAEAENRLAKSLLDNEMLKSSILELTKSIIDKQKYLDDQESVLKSLEKQIKDKHYLCRSYQSKIAWKESKIEEIKKKKAEKEAHASPLELKSFNMEEELQKLQTDIENFENDWLNLENDLLMKADLRNKLVGEVLKLRKDYTRIEQYRIRGEEKISEVQFRARKCGKELEFAHKQLERIEFETVEKGKLRDQLEKLAYIHEKNYEQDLKVAENEYLEMQKQNKELKETIEDMTKHIQATQREYLEWDKKLRLAYTERERFRQEMESSGEIGAMKLEIHRMEVRLSQLKKVQDKMMSDLEHCVTRRDSIIGAAEAREIRFRTGGKQVAKIHIQRRISDMKMKLKRTKQTAHILLKALFDAKEREIKLTEDYTDINVQMDVLRNGLREVELQIHEGQIHKHACLEMTVLRQRKARLLEDLKFGRYKNVNKSEIVLVKEEEKQSTIHCALEEVLDTLKIDFPHLGLQIVQIINSLKHPEKLHS